MTYTAHELLDLEDVVSAVNEAATRVTRRYRAYVSRDDMLQAGWLWVLEHPSKVNRNLPDPEEDQRNQRRVYRRLVTLFERALEGVARAEKAAASGYSTDDEYFYEGALIEQLLPAIWDEDFLFDPPQQDDREKRGRQDPAEGNNWPALIADIHRAWKGADLTIDQRAFLMMRFGEGRTIDHCAKVMQVSKETVLKQVKQGVSAIARELHGVRPLYAGAEQEE